MAEGSVTARLLRAANRCSAVFGAASVELFQLRTSSPWRRLSATVAIFSFSSATALRMAL